MCGGRRAKKYSESSANILQLLHYFGKDIIESEHQDIRQ
jgi:hypothetical protein